MKLKNFTRHEKWFDIPGEDAKILIREISPGDLAEIKDTVLLFGDTGGPSSGKAEFRREYITRHIAAWKGVEAEDGSQLPLSYENKVLLLMQELPSDPEDKEQPKNMADFIWKGMAEVNAEAAKQREEAGKNS